MLTRIFQALLRLAVNFHSTYKLYSCAHSLFLSITFIGHKDELSENNPIITSLRLDNIIGYHEMIFSFPPQTIRLVHESMRRKTLITMLHSRMTHRGPYTLLASSRNREPRAKSIGGFKFEVQHIVNSPLLHKDQGVDTSGGVKGG